MVSGSLALVVFFLIKSTAQKGKQELERERERERERELVSGREEISERKES